MRLSARQSSVEKPSANIDKTNAKRISRPVSDDGNVEHLGKDWLLLSSASAGSYVVVNTQSCHLTFDGLMPFRPRSLNKRSIKPARYGEPFVKRHGLFFLIVASRSGVV